MKKFKFFCLINLIMTTILGATTGNIQSKLKIPNVPIAMPNDTETLDVLKQLLAKYNDALAKSQYYKKLSEELNKKASQYDEQSAKMHQTSQELLKFIVAKMNEHQKAIIQHKNNSLKANSGDNRTETHPNLEHFIENLAANLKKK